MTPKRCSQAIRLTPPLDTAGKLLLPWAAAAAGDWKTALATPDSSGDHLVGQIALLDQALPAREPPSDRRGGSGVPQVAVDQRRRRASTPPPMASFWSATGARGTRSASTSPALEGRAIEFAPAGRRWPARRRATRLRRAPTLQPGRRQGPARRAAAFMLAEKQPELGLDYLRLVLRLDPKRDEAWLAGRRHAERRRPCRRRAAGLCRAATGLVRPMSRRARG